MFRFCISLATSLLISCFLVSCSMEGDDNIRDIPDQGLFISIEANRHQSNDNVQIAASIFKDGKAINLVAGDLIEVQGETNSTLLKDPGSYKGSYAGTLAETEQNIIVTVVHKPLEARDGRWYPIDIIGTDPGPGELLGHNAVLHLPPDIMINSPQAATTYTELDGSIELSWDALDEGDQIRIRSAVSCDNGLAILSYGTEILIGDDDGSETISVGQFIYDSTDSIDNQLIEFVADAGRAMLQEMLDQLSAGNIDKDFFASRKPVNPAESSCDIQLFLFRQREGAFDDAFDSGSVVGSSSTEVTVHYQ